MENQVSNQHLNPALEMKYGGFWIRFVAHLIDYFVLGALRGIVFIPIFLALGLSTVFAFDNFDISNLETLAFAAGFLTFISIYGIVHLFSGWLYYALMESSRSQATLGKMALGLKVIDLEGERISFLKATARYFSKIISRAIFWVGYIMAGFTDRKQALHDFIASTYVIYKN